MLSSGSVDLPERQRTIQGAITWSYDLLDQPSRRLFSRLSVFAGGGRLEEIETVSGPASDLGIDVIEGLSLLLDQSLLRRVDADDAPRFQMLHVIREYAMDCLDDIGESADLHRRHLQAYTEMAEMVAPELLRRDRRRWLDVMEADHDNFRTALEWAVANQEVDLALRLASALWRFWQARGHLHEARRRIDAVLALPGGELRYRAKAIEALGGIHWWQGRMEECGELYEQVLALQREIGDEREVANALYNFSLVVSFMGRQTGEMASIEELTPLVDEADEIYQRLGDVGGMGDIQWSRGNAAAFILEDLPAAIEHMKKSADYYAQAGNEFGLGWALFETGSMLRQTGEFLEGWEYLERGLALFSGHRDVSAAVLFIAQIAAVANGLGDIKRAHRLIGAFTSLQITSGTDIVGIEVNQIPGMELSLLEALTGDAAVPYREGRAMGFDEAVAYALAGPTDEGFEAQRAQ